MPTLFSLEGLAASAAFAKVAYDTYSWYQRQRRHRQIMAGLGEAGRSRLDPRTEAEREYEHARRSMSGRRGPRSLAALEQVMAQTPVRRELVSLRNDGDKGAAERVAYITKMIRKHRTDPYIRKIASDVLSRKKANGEWAVPEKNWTAEVRAIFAFIRSQVRYQRDPYGTDTYTSALRTLGWFKAGDCDCYTILAGAMLQSVGYPVRIRIIHQRGKPTWGHIYLMVGIPPMGPEKWVPFDASMNKPLGFQPPRFAIARFRDFAVE